MTQQAQYDNDTFLICANYEKCQQERYWEKSYYLKASTHREKIRIMLCNTCYANFLHTSDSHWVLLKNKIDGDMKLGKPI